MEEHYRFRKSDLVAVAVVVCLIAASVLFFYGRPKTDAGSVEVYQSGKLLYSFSLYENRSFTVGGDYENTVVIENGTVRIESSTCPGHDCVHMGSISSTGQNLICLPNRLEIRLSGDSGEVDIISR